MDRLLAGRPQRTDGRLIKDNLWKEVDVSRVTTGFQSVTVSAAMAPSSQRWIDHEYG
jgi:hypothetical protein